MSTLTAQKIAIVLEIFSFFFVTLDLYGEARLNKLDKSIKSFIDRIKQIPIGEILFNFVSSPFLNVGRVLTGSGTFSDGCSGHIQFLILILYLAFINSLIHIDTGSDIVDLFLLLLIGGLIVPIFLLIVSLTIAIFALVIEVPFKILISFSRFLLFRLNLNGSLVVIGTFTFVMSKLLSLIYL